VALAVGGAGLDQRGVVEGEPVPQVKGEHLLAEAAQRLHPALIDIMNAEMRPRMSH
jgi:hypothetical protein